MQVQSYLMMEGTVPSRGILLEIARQKYTGSTSACVIPDAVFRCYHLRKFETMLGRGILPNVN